jgi:hypothetical protein
MGRQPGAQRLDGDQPTLSDLDALEGTGPKRFVNRRPASRAASPGDTASGSGLEGGRVFCICMIARPRRSSIEHRRTWSEAAAQKSGRKIQ